MDNPLRLIPGPAAERIRLLTHDPANRRNLAYLAASEGGEPILLNRLLTDANVVLPVGCMQREHSAGYFGIHTTIYPEYSDQHTQARFRKHDRFTGNGHHRELQHEVNHVAWLLGVNFSVQVVPAAGDGILHVLAGQSDVVRRQCRELYRAAWNRSVAHRASWSSRRSKAPSGNRHGRTWAACWRRLGLGRRGRGDRRLLRLGGARRGPRCSG